MSNELNLDELAPVKRTVTLNGVTHEVREMTVEAFVAASKSAKALEQKGDALSEEENIDATIEHLNRVIPTLDKDAIRNLNLKQLGALVAFVNGVVEQAGEQGK